MPVANLRGGNDGADANVSALQNEVISMIPPEMQHQTHLRPVRFSAIVAALGTLAFSSVARAQLADSVAAMSV